MFEHMRANRPGFKVGAPGGQPCCLRLLLAPCCPLLGPARWRGATLGCARQPPLSLLGARWTCPCRCGTGRRCPTWIDTFFSTTRTPEGPPGTGGRLGGCVGGGWAADGQMHQHGRQPSAAGPQACTILRVCCRQCPACPSLPLPAGPWQTCWWGCCGTRCWTRPRVPPRHPAPRRCRRCRPSRRPCCPATGRPSRRRACWG